MKLVRPKTKDISIVMPCLNEIKTVGECVDVAYKYIKDHNLNGDVIVVDNGSTDGSGAEAKAQSNDQFIREYKCYRESDI